MAGSPSELPGFELAGGHGHAALPHVSYIVNANIANRRVVIRMEVDALNATRAFRTEPGGVAARSQQYPVRAGFGSPFS